MLQSDWLSYSNTISHQIAMAVGRQSTKWRRFYAVLVEPLDRKPSFAYCEERDRRRINFRISIWHRMLSLLIQPEHVFRAITVVVAGAPYCINLIHYLVTSYYCNERKQETFASCLFSSRTENDVETIQVKLQSLQGRHEINNYSKYITHNVLQVL